MNLALYTNMESMNAQRNLVRSLKGVGGTFGRFSSGLQISQSANSSDGISIQTRMSAQIRGINQSIQNANDAVAVIQVEDGALEETSHTLQKVRELSARATDASLNQEDRQTLQKEAEKLLSGIDRISKEARSDNEKILGGANDAMGDVHEGGEAIHVTIGNAEITAFLGGNTETLVSDLGSEKKASLAMKRLDSAMGSVSDVRASLGTYQEKFEGILKNLSAVMENTLAQSPIGSAEVAIKDANMIKSAISQQAGTAILAQANQDPHIAMQLLG